MKRKKRTLNTLNNVKLTTLECLALSSAVMSTVSADLCEEADRDLLQPALEKLLDAGDISMAVGDNGITFTVNVTECPDCEGKHDE